MAFNPVEREAIVLRAAWEMIDDMVNFAIFMPLGERTRDTNLMPRASDSLRLFNVLIGDFLSPLVRKGRGELPFGLASPPSPASPSDLTFLFYLRHVCAHPQLGSNPASLSESIEAFATWLQEASFVEGVWFPSVQVEANLRVQRREWIRICGDIGKHSFTRLETNSAKIERILAEHGHPIENGMGYVVLPEFWEWFHTHLFAYHASTIAEFLNNIRWGIFAYLRPEFERAFHRIEPKPMYSFRVPDMIANPLAHSMYWDLMNLCRSEPWFPRFTVTRSLKSSY